MRKLLSFTFIALISPAQSSEQVKPLSTLQDSDYVNFAQEHWGEREGGWKFNAGLKAVVDEIETQSTKCSKAMKYVPLPVGAPPTATAFAKYVISLRNSQKKLANGNKYSSCINEAVLTRKSPAEITQIE